MTGYETISTVDERTKELSFNPGAEAVVPPSPEKIIAEAQTMREISRRGQLESYNGDEVESVGTDTVDDASPLTLEEFLAEHEVVADTTEIEISERLAGYKFKIGSLSKTDHEKYSKAAIVRGKNGRVVDQKQHLFNELVITNHCIYPNFKSVEFLRKLGVNTPAEALYKVLKLGEITMLANEILRFNGFDDDYEAKRQQAKN